MKLPSNYWTKERCHEESLKYVSPNELKNNNDYVYVKCFKNKWLVSNPMRMVKLLYL
jgi:hypothetical protein